MNLLLLLMRIIHVVGGVFWAGGMFLVANFLMPAIAEAGPAAGPVMAGLMKRRLLTVTPIIAVLTILSGFWLFWHDASGTGSQFMGSPMGTTLGVGALAALIAFGVGVGVMRPAQLKSMALAQQASSKPESEKAALMAEVTRLRGRAGAAGRAVAALLGIAALTMAIARYV